MSSVSISLREQFIATGGSSFSGSKLISVPDENAIQALTWAGAATNISAGIHFTAPVGSSYEQVLDPAAAGADAFGVAGTVGVFIFFNRSDTQTCTLRFDGGAATDNSYVEVPAGKWFILTYPAIVETNDSTGENVGTVSAKFASSSDALEVWGFSVNGAFS